MNEQLKESDLWEIDQPQPSGQNHRQRVSWSVQPSNVGNHQSDSQRYLIKKAIGIIGLGIPIEDACARVWGPEAVTPGLIREVEHALKSEK